MQTAKTRGRIILNTLACIVALGIWSGDFLRVVYYSLLALFVGAFVLMPLYRLSPLHPLYRFPGPILHKVSELPMFYYAAQGIRHTVVKGLHDQYGPIVQTGPNTVSFSSVPAISQIYGSSNALDKTTAYDMHPIPGEGLFFIKDKATHTRRRKIWNRAFSNQALTQYHDPLVAEIQHLIDALLKRTQEKGKVDLVRILPQYAYDSTNVIFLSGHAFSPSLLDSDDHENIVKEGSTSFGVSESLTHIEPFFHMLNELPLAKLLKFEVLCTQTAARRIQNGPKFKDGMSYMLDGDGGQPTLSHDDLAIEVETAIIGGSETVGAMSIFTIYFLITHKQWLEKLRNELDETFPSETPLQPINPLDKLVILNAFIQEVFRLGMPFSGLPRLVPSPGMAIDGKYVPGGTEVNVPIWTYHVDEEVFPNANTFDPGRWIVNGEFSPTPALLTFGAGPFNCVGSRLAYVQLRLITAMLVLNLDFISADDFDELKFWKGVRNRRATTFVESFYVQAVPRKAVV
ncbi:cytochrome P450 [Mycena rebaudengoi]|nr:cytochrome P450 [Mycena rebaudengoi]